MPVVAIVGPPDVGKSALAELFEEKLGDRVYVDHSPELWVSVEEAYQWAFSELSAIAIEHDDALHLFNGFPHPDHWAFWASDWYWTLPQANLEKRMVALDAKFLYVAPDDWNNYQHASLNLHSLYLSWLRYTKIGTKKVRSADISLNLVEEVCNDLGFSYA